MASSTGLFPTTLNTYGRCKMSDLDKVIRKYTSKKSHNFDGVGHFFANIRNAGSFTADGVGSKIELLKELGPHYLDIAGNDLVAMSANDILCGLVPMKNFLCGITVHKDYPLENIARVMFGIKEACKQHDIQFIGGETAFLDTVPEGFIDLMGFGIGPNCPNGPPKAGNCHLVGLKSNGWHSNGYTTVRKYLKDKPLAVKRRFSAPTVFYNNLILPWIDRFEIVSCAHITGGGLGNIRRMLEPRFCLLSPPRIKIPKPNRIFTDVLNFEYTEDCNMGIGMVVALKTKQGAKDYISYLNGGMFRQGKAFYLGYINETELAL
jgi:phosphoribosylformylglycinamidine cyclo-ligase